MKFAFLSCGILYRNNRKRYIYREKLGDNYNNFNKSFVYTVCKNIKRILKMWNEKNIKRYKYVQGEGEKSSIFSTVVSVGAGVHFRFDEEKRIPDTWRANCIVFSIRFGARASRRYARSRGND